MADYLHGAYGEIQAAGSKATAQSGGAIVYVGTAPVHQLANGAANVNKPVLVTGMADARRLFGYSTNWTDYTLCEAMYAHFELGGVGPLVLINVLDPATHKEATGGTGSLTPVNGRLVIANAEKVILDTVVIETTASPAVTKVKGADYTIAYDEQKKQVVATEITAGALGTAALDVTWDIIKPSEADSTALIGAADGAGLNTGLYAVRNVYQQTGRIPSVLLAPGFSGIPDVHTAMYTVSQKVGGHWDMYILADIPITHGGTGITLATAAAFKSANGYDKPNETVYFPLAKGSDDKVYHLSVLAAANLQKLLIEQDGIPYKTASNTECPIISNLYLGADVTGRIYDDQLINESLNKNGIASAVFMGGRWVIWGCHSADYSYADGDRLNVSETNRMMLYYISNDFQHRRTRNVDTPLTGNDIKAIVAEEQMRLDALVRIGALSSGSVRLNAAPAALSDVYSGNYSFLFSVTTTPLAKSLTALVNWTEDGFTTYYADLA